MRFYTNTLTLSDVRDAVIGLSGVRIEVTEHGSRSHNRAFEVALFGNSPYRSQRDRDEHAATWDEWGVFISRLYRIDWEMVAGSVKHPAYRNTYDFHLVTGYRFQFQTMPKDTHSRHQFAFNPFLFYSECKKCSAISNHHRAAVDYPA